MLFGNPHIKDAQRKAAGDPIKPGARGHGGGDGHDARVTGGLILQRLAENGCVAGGVGLGFRLRARGHIEPSDPVVFACDSVGGSFGGGVALALHRPPKANAFGAR